MNQREHSVLLSNCLSMPRTQHSHRTPATPAHCRRKGFERIRTWFQCPNTTPGFLWLAQHTQVAEEKKFLSNETRSSPEEAPEFSSHMGKSGKRGSHPCAPNPLTVCPVLQSRPVVVYSHPKHALSLQVGSCLPLDPICTGAGLEPLMWENRGALHFP